MTDSRTAGRTIHAVVMLSLHTSPLKQPGSGDAGGLNVYVMALALQLAGRGVRVDIYTLDVADGLDADVTVAPGLTVHQIALPGGRGERITLDDFDADRLARRIAADPAVANACVVHSHYWLSGLVALRLRALDDLPIVHTMHTMAKVKHRDFGQPPDPPERVRAETELTKAACLIANTEREARDMVDLYAARPDRIQVVHPGVDHTIFSAGDQKEARARLGLTGRDLIVLFVGRVQYLKGADVVIDALAELERTAPQLAGRVSAIMIGGDSGGRGNGVESLRELAAGRGVANAITFAEPVEPAELVDWYRAADVVAVPSRSESFGLVAAEAGACGTPVIAADVGGLSELVDPECGRLVAGHDPVDWARALSTVLSEDDVRARMSRAAPDRMAKFDWSATADETMHIYETAKECNESITSFSLGGTA